MYTYMISHACLQTFKPDTYTHTPPIPDQNNTTIIHIVKLSSTLL